MMYEERGNIPLKDEEYMYLAKEAARASRCAKKQLGCVLVSSNGVVTTGTNGAPYPLEECNPCPRLNSHSGTDLHLCRAVHAERQALLKAARRGLKTNNSKLYSYMGVPCSNCMLELIEAGVSEIICAKDTYYDELSKDILREWISKGGKFRIINLDL